MGVVRDVVQLVSVLNAAVDTLVFGANATAPAPVPAPTPAPPATAVLAGIVTGARSAPDTPLSVDAGFVSSTFFASTTYNISTNLCSLIISVTSS